ncbi:hypothetical protein F53441_3618 [Fusarium austroafricanum]|uniref:AB hydrolase-1 domain-containing protein n=1 Tax=Fusarium austroafricanum TaxID=2364996 RepID=A0A8H4KPS1_9HYPO|nr:hypothetical protein F53441_3618 [Fusarium austroafricanum]
MSQTKPVIAIVPGGFCSPEVYQDVANTLQQDGFTVIITILTTTKNLASQDPKDLEYKDLANKTLLDDVKEIHAALASELEKGSEVVIFGHSYGSLPALLAIEGHTFEERKAKSLPGGIKGYVAISGFPYAVRGKNIRGNTEEAPLMPYWTYAEGVVHIQEDAKPLFFSDLPAEKQDEAWKMVLGSQSRKSFNHLSEFINSDVTIPKTYISCEKDEVVPPAFQEMCILGGGFDKVEKLPSGHFPFVSIPEETAKLFARIAME